MGSYSPPVRRKDSIGLLFSYNPEYNSVCDVIFDHLKISHDDIIGFQQLNSRKYVVKFRHSAVFQHFCELYDEKEIQVAPGKFVQVANFSRVFTYVCIKYAPFDMDNSLLENILSRYGRLYGIRLNRFSYGKAEGLLNGVRTAKMELKGSIPSSINIQGQNIVFFNIMVKRKRVLNVEEKIIWQWSVSMTRMIGLIFTVLKIFPS